MNEMEPLTEMSFNFLKPFFFCLDLVFHLCGLKGLKGGCSNHCVYVCCLVGFVYLLTTNEHAFRDDVVVGCCLSTCAYVTLSLVCKEYIGHVLWTLFVFCCEMNVYGKLRVFICVVSLVLFAAVLTYSAVQAITFAHAAFTDNIMWRLDVNVIQIEEDRRIFEEQIVHPITKGEKYPLFLNKIYRYPMEDVSFTCEFTQAWLSNAHPTEYQVMWRKNGVPLTLSDRHRYQLSFKEIEENETISQLLMKSRGVSHYEVKATLTIHLLRESEFGTYTCHRAKHMNISLQDFNKNYAKLIQGKQREQATQQKQQPQTGKTTSGQRQNEVEKKRLFQDEFLHVGEFRLIKMQRRQEIIRAPASSIFYFTTAYWHLSWEDEVEIDYSVNRQSYNELCRDGYFHGCSKALLLYWLFKHGDGGRFGAPPLQLLTIWKHADYPAKRYSLVHCLCENAYGYHSVKYLRRYYNRTTGQSQLFEIQHPHVLVVVPREQNMLNLFQNRSQCSPVIERPVCEKPPSICKTSWDFQTIQEFAEAAVKYFHYLELAAIVVAFIVVGYVFRKSVLFLEIVGRHIRRLSLEGSMGYLLTAGWMALAAHHHNNENGTAEVHYDVFLSYSDTETDTQTVQESLAPLLESYGLKVCLRDRDLAPNLPEIQSISTAIENSDKFLIFLTSAYFQDHFRKDFEAAMIMEAVSDRGHGVSSVLLIKLEQCDIPAWLSHLNLHDWTTANLTRQDHYLRLLKWLEPPESRWILRSKLDVFLTILPVLTIMLFSISLGVSLLVLYGSRDKETVRDFT